MLLVTISTCLVLLITIDEGFWCFNPTYKLGYRLPTVTRSNTRNLRSHTVLSFTRGGGGQTLPVGQSGGTGVQMTQTSLAIFWELNDFIRIISIYV